MLRKSFYEHCCFVLFVCYKFYFDAKRFYFFIRIVFTRNVHEPARVHARDEDVELRMNFSFAQVHMETFVLFKLSDWFERHPSNGYGKHKG